MLRSRGASRGLTLAVPVGFAPFSADDYEDASLRRIYDYTPKRSIAAVEDYPENVTRFAAYGSSRRKA